MVLYNCFIFIILFFCVLHPIFILAENEEVFEHQGCLQLQDIDRNKTTFAPSSSLLDCTSKCGDSCVAVLFSQGQSHKAGCAQIYKESDIPKSTKVACSYPVDIVNVWLKPYSRGIWPCREGMPHHSVVRVPGGAHILCDMATSFNEVPGEWIVIQHRESQDVDFNRGWEDYKKGFGHVNGNFWLGLENIYFYTNQWQCEIRVNLKRNDPDYHAFYQTFRISDESDKYRLQVGGYMKRHELPLTSGLELHNTFGFSTRDKDNDDWLEGNYGSYYRSGWWFNPDGLSFRFSTPDNNNEHFSKGKCSMFWSSYNKRWLNRCGNTNLNGLWGQPGNKGVYWASVLKEGSLNFSEMMIRRKSVFLE